MNLPHTFVDWERHAVAGYDRIEDDVGVSEFAVHAVKSLYKLSGIKHVNALRDFGAVSLAWYFHALGPRPSAICR